MMNPAERDRRCIEMHCLASRPVAYTNTIYMENTAPSDSTYGSETASEHPVYNPVAQPWELPRYTRRASLALPDLAPHGVGQSSRPNVAQQIPLNYRVYEELDYNLPPPEVESMLFLDIFILFSGFWILALGVMNFNSCPVSKVMPNSALIYGVLAIATSALLLIMQIVNAGRRSFSYDVVVVSCRLLRLVMAAVCAVALADLYQNYPPEDEDAFDSKYCQPWFFWSLAFVYLLYSMCFILTFLHAIVLGLWYIC